MPNDTRWDLWLKILCHYQALPGSNPANNPSPRLADTLRDLRRKVLKAVSGNGDCACGDNSNIRLLEDGDFRITESGDTRILE